MRALILEDDENLLMAFTHALEDDGYTVDACTSEYAATKQMLLHGSAIDVFVLDLCIGSGSSLSLADYAGYASPEAAVIIVTGFGLYPHGEIQHFSRNIDWVLRKPIRMRDLQSVVRHTINRKHLRRA